MHRSGIKRVGMPISGAPYTGCRRGVPRAIHAALGIAYAVSLPLMAVGFGCRAQNRTPGGASAGETLYAAYCIPCHGAEAANDRRGANPRMRLSNAVRLSDEQWRRVVLEGRGAMPAFAARLNPEQVDEIAHYVRALAAGR